MKMMTRNTVMTTAATVPPMLLSSLSPISAVVAPGAIEVLLVLWCSVGLMIVEVTLSILEVKVRVEFGASGVKVEVAFDVSGFKVKVELEASGIKVKFADGVVGIVVG